VISEEDIRKAVRIIGESLEELDVVSYQLAGVCSQDSKLIYSWSKSQETMKRNTTPS
jgi:hypothetical protein